VTWQVIVEAAEQAEIAETFDWYEQRVSVLACLHHRRNPARWPGN
jgi:hypothetical protein